MNLLIIINLTIEHFLLKWQNIHKNWWIKILNLFFTLLKKKNQGKYDKPISIPKYLDKINGREVVQYEKGAINTKGLADNKIKLSGTNIIVKTKIARQVIQAVRIVPCNGYIKIEILYKIQECNLKSKEDNIASVDLGLNNLMTVTFTNNKPLIINGKPLKSINQYYNKKKAKYTSLVDKCNSKKTSQRLKRLSFMYCSIAITSNLYIFEFCLLAIISTYGGFFACVHPALADMFTARYLSTIHGRAFIVWALAVISSSPLLTLCI